MYTLCPRPCWCWLWSSNGKFQLYWSAELPDQQKPGCFWIAHRHQMPSGKGHCNVSPFLLMSHRNFLYKLWYRGKIIKSSINFKQIHVLGYRRKVIWPPLSKRTHSLHRMKCLLVANENMTVIYGNYWHLSIHVSYKLKHTCVFSIYFYANRALQSELNQVNRKKKSNQQMITGSNLWKLLWPIFQYFPQHAHITCFRKHFGFSKKLIEFRYLARRVPHITSQQKLCCRFFSDVTVSLVPFSHADRINIHWWLNRDN